MTYYLDVWKNSTGHCMAIIFPTSPEGAWPRDRKVLLDACLNARVRSFIRNDTGSQRSRSYRQVPNSTHNPKLPQLLTFAIFGFPLYTSRVYLAPFRHSLIRGQRARGGFIHVFCLHIRRGDHPPHSYRLMMPS